MKVRQSECLDMAAMVRFIAFAAGRRPAVTGAAAPTRDHGGDRCMRGGVQPFLVQRDIHHLATNQ